LTYGGIFLSEHMVEDLLMG